MILENSSAWELIASLKQHAFCKTKKKPKQKAKQTNKQKPYRTASHCSSQNFLLN